MHVVVFRRLLLYIHNKADYQVCCKAKNQTRVHVFVKIRPVKTIYVVLRSLYVRTIYNKANYHLIGRVEACIILNNAIMR
jgi:cytidylate kinase